MKIEEVFSIYEFLGKLSFLSFLGVAILIILIIFTILVPLKERINISWRLIIASEILVLASLIILYAEAKNRNKLLPIANSIKSYFVNTGFFAGSFRQILNATHYKDSASFLSLIKQLPDQYPSDFLLIHMHSNSKTGLDTFGIRLIDPIALEKIEKKLDDKAVTTSLLISQYLQRQPDAIIYTADTSQLKLIDNEGWLIGQDFFRRIAGRNGLVPIYDTDSSYLIGGYHITAFTLLSKLDSNNNIK